MPASLDARVQRQRAACPDFVADRLDLLFVCQCIVCAPALRDLVVGDRLAIIREQPWYLPGAADVLLELGRYRDS